MRRFCSPPQASIEGVGKTARLPVVITELNAQLSTFAKLVVWRAAANEIPSVPATLGSR